MIKTLKKTLAVVLCSTVLLSVPGMTKDSYALDRNLGNTHSVKSIFYKKYSSTVDISKYVSVENENGKNYLQIKVDTNDLFNRVNEDFENMSKQNPRIKNLVMFGEHKEFPSMSYTLEFPKSVKISDNDIKEVSKSYTVSSIKHKINENKVTFTLNLGNWNDYGTFFSNYGKEVNDGGEHYVLVKVPYEFVGINNEETKDNLVKGYGHCKLYYYKFIFSSNIVDLNLTQNDFILNK